MNRFVFKILLLCGQRVKICGIKLGTTKKKCANEEGQLLWPRIKMHFYFLSSISSPLQRFCESTR